jgi:hypothetical protein
MQTTHCTEVRKTSDDNINKATLNWFHKMRALNARISGPGTQEAALQFAKEFKVQDFQESSGWLESFKNKNLISQKRTSGKTKCHKM